MEFYNGSYIIPAHWAYHSHCLLTLNVANEKSAIGIMSYLQLLLRFYCCCVLQFQYDWISFYLSYFEEKFWYFFPKSFSCVQLEKAMAIHSGTLAWKIPWMEEPGRLQSMGLRRVGHNWATSLSLFPFMHWRRKQQPTRVLAWRIPGMGEHCRLPSMGSHRVGHNRSDLAAAAAVGVLVLPLLEVGINLNF